MEDFNLAKIYADVKSRIIGRDKEIKEILAALRAGRNIVLEGPPGTSKSTILREITRQIHIPFYIVEGSAELTPGKLVGTHNPAKVLAGGYTQEAFDHGPLTDAMLSGGFLYIEEFNRMPEDVMNVLLRAMDERRIAIPRVGELQAKHSFRLVGAMNPFDDVGTERLSRALSDRLCRVELDYQSEEEEIEIVHLITGVNNPMFLRLAVRLIRRTRKHPDLKMGSSVRGAIDLVLIAQERFSLEGLSITEESLSAADPQVRAILLDCALMSLSGRVWVSETSDRKVKEIIKEIWEGLQWIALPGLPEGKIVPGTAQEDEGPYLATSHSSQESRSSGKKKTEGVRRRQSRSQDTTTAGIFGIAAAQKEYLSENGDCHAPLEDKNLPHLLRGRLRQEEEKSAERERAKRLAEKIILTLPQKQRGLAWRRGKVSLAHYCFGSADIDIDRTLERVIGKEVIDYQDFVVYERSQEKRAYALILDVSGSMRGESIVSALVALSAFVKTVSRSSDYSIITFCDRMNILKPMGQRKSLASLTTEVFKVPTNGMTDLTAGLRAGLLQLSKSLGRKKVGVLLTDGAHNKHSDPFSLAQRYPQLHVVGIRPPWLEARRTCEKLARLGRGECVVLHELEEIPKAIQSLLCNDFFVGKRVA